MRKRAAVALIFLGAGLLIYLGITTQTRGDPNLIVSTRRLVDEPFAMLPAVGVLILVVGGFLWFTARRKRKVIT